MVDTAELRQSLNPSNMTTNVSECSNRRDVNDLTKIDVRVALVDGDNDNNVAVAVGGGGGDDGVNRCEAPPFALSAELTDVRKYSLAHAATTGEKLFRECEISVDSQTESGTGTTVVMSTDAAGDTAIREFEENSVVVVDDWKENGAPTAVALGPVSATVMGFAPHTPKPTAANHRVKFRDHVTVHYTRTHYDGRPTFPIYDVNHWISHQPTHYAILLALALLLIALTIIEVTQWNVRCNKSLHYLFLNNIGATLSTIVILSSFIMYRHLSVMRKTAFQRRARRSTKSIHNNTVSIPHGSVRMASSPRTAQSIVDSAMEMELARKKKLEQGHLNDNVTMSCAVASSETENDGTRLKCSYDGEMHHSGDQGGKQTEIVTDTAAREICVGNKRFEPLYGNNSNSSSISCDSFGEKGHVMEQRNDNDQSASFTCNLSRADSIMVHKKRLLIPSSIDNNKTSVERGDTTTPLDIDSDSETEDSFDVAEDIESGSSSEKGQAQSSTSTSSSFTTFEPLKLNCEKQRMTLYLAPYVSSCCLFTASCSFRM